MPNPYNNILQKTFDRKIPFSVHWELTYRCNLSCLHCYATNRDLKDELSMDVIESGLEQLAGMGCLFLTFTGGEIFCRTDLMRILRSARKKGFAMHLFTNGTRLTPGLADKVAEIEPLSMEMSLYSMDPAIHDGITGQSGSHRKTLSAIKLCAARQINTVIKCTLLKRNVAGFRELRDFAGKIGARFVFDFALVPADDGSRPMTQHGLSADEIYQFILANALPDWQPPVAQDMSAPVCGAGSNALCIGPTGDVFPCLAVRHAVGNIRKQTLREIWDFGAAPRGLAPREREIGAPKLRGRQSPAPAAQGGRGPNHNDNSALLDNVRKSRYCDLVECANCTSSAFCLRCAGVALAECGNILGKSESACVVAGATRRAAETLMRSRTNRTEP